MAEIRLPTSAASFLNHDLIENVTAMSTTEFGFDDDTGEFYVRIDSLDEAGRFLEAAREHGFSVEFDGVDRLTFVPPVDDA